MILSIEVSESINDKFIRFLIRKIKMHLVLNLNLKKIRAFNDKVEEMQLFEKIYPNSSIKFDISQAIRISLNALRFRKVKDTYIIYIDPNVMMPGYRVSVSTACKLLNYGNSEISEYPVFSSTFTYMQRNLTLLLKEYRRFHKLH